MKMLHLKKSFYFLRHGETDWNKEQKVMGQCDIPLNKTGVIQANNVAQKIKSLKINTIVSSPLKRARETAEIIKDRINKPIVIEKNLQECAWGIMEGKIKGNNFYKGIAFNPERWWQEGITPEGAESFAKFTKRVVNSVAYHLSVSENILFVAHGGVIMAMFATINISKWNIENVGLYHFIPQNTEITSWKVDLIR